VAAVTLAIQNGVVMAFAVLYLPLIAEFRASRADVAVVQSAVLMLGGISGPLIGWVFDRLGPRHLFQAGALLAAAGFLVASRVESLPALIVSYGVIGGLGLAALGSQANMTVAALWYPRARGRAIALVDLGTGFGAFCFIPLAQMLVSAVGWRGTLLAWAVLLVTIVIPLSQLQRLPGPVVGSHAAPVESVTEWTLSRAVQTPDFWWLALMRFFASGAFPLMNVHMVAYAVGQGVTPAAAAAALGAVSLVSLPGRLATGWLCDLIGRAPTLTIAYGCAAAGIGCLVLLGATGTSAWLVLYVLLYGLAQGSSGIVGSARAADVFAGPAFGTIYGVMVLALGPGEALGTWIGGKIYDVTGSYLGAFMVAAAALGASLICIWRVWPEPRRG
jgi:predicted MFS family arabinose efflux permease